MSTVSFEDLDLNPQILRAIKEMGFEEATPIQAQSIPAVMSGRDVIGQAQTGTGKTASFGIPLLHKVDPKLKKTQALILCPTRELCHSGIQRVTQSGKIHPRYQNPSDLRWTGDWQTDPIPGRRRTDHRWYTGSCNGSFKKKNNPLRSYPHHYSG